MKNLNLLLLFIVCLISCKKNGLSPIEPTTNPNLFTVTLNGQNVQVLKKDNQYHFYDDVIFSQETFDSLRQLYQENQTVPRSAFNPTIVNYWPNGIVYYSISPVFNSHPTEKQEIMSAIGHWESNTDIQFIERTNQPNYVNFIRITSGPLGYSDFIGKKGGYQEIGLFTTNNYYDIGTIIHEIGHASGLYHEQSRNDRDDHLIINWNNIGSDANSQWQFKTYTEQGRPGADFGNFDWYSVMLYGSTAGSINQNPTMLKRSDNSTFSGNTYLSIGDIETIQALYRKKYYKMRYVTTSGSRGSIGYKGKAYLDFFTDSTFITPHILDIPKIIFYTEGGPKVISCQPGFLVEDQHVILQPGQNSYYIGPEYHTLKCSSSPEEDASYIDLY